MQRPGAAERDSELRLSEVLAYLDECDSKLRTELELTGNRLHHQPPGRWSAGQVIQHLILAETVMLSLWLLLPRLSRLPKVVRVINQGNTLLWRALGMKIFEPADEQIVPARATQGRFRAPVFLRPISLWPGFRSLTADQLLERRRAVRARTIKALSRVEETTLNHVRWSLPHSGSYTLLELARFIGIHEMHHLPQLQRLRLS